LEAIMQLQQLQRLDCWVGVRRRRLLLRLAQLPALQHLAQRYRRFDVSVASAADTAAVWPHLSQLSELQVTLVKYEVCNEQHWNAIRTSLAACASLTKLEVSTEICLAVKLRRAEGHMGRTRLLANLASLTNLKDLAVTDASYVTPGEALALTALTCLTQLELCGSEEAMGDLAATAIASSCKQLQHLDLRWCDLHSMECLAAVAQRTQLTKLRLEGNDGLTQQGLMLLTGLKQLQQLGVDRNTEVTNEVVERFWAALRLQQQYRLLSTAWAMLQLCVM
jgi:hypothetical protein